MMPLFRPVSLATALSVVCLLSGCGSSSTPGSGGTTTTTSPTGSLAAGGATNVYALNNASSGATTANDVLVYPAGSSGTATAATVTLALNTALPTGAAVDGSGLLYVASSDDVTGLPLVSVYPAGATAAATPVRSFAPNQNYQAIGIAVGSTGQTYVLEGQYDTYGDVLGTQVEVFAAGAAAGALPIATIGGSATLMIDPQDIAVDATGKVYVANYEDNGVSQILAFAAGATGSVAPVQTITLNGVITGIATDSSANMYAAVTSSAGAGGVVEYAAGATGSPTATKTIAGSATGLSSAATGAVRVDSVGNIWLIEQQSSVIGTSTHTYFDAWGPSATGNVAPAVLFSPPSLTNPNAAFAIH